MLNGGVDVVYDTVTSPETLEVGVRVLRVRGVPSWHWASSRPNASNGRRSTSRNSRWWVRTPSVWKPWTAYRQHAMRFYLDWVEDGSLDVTAILTHSFRLEAYREAFQACLGQGESGAVKVVFDHREPLS